MRIARTLMYSSLRRRLFVCPKIINYYFVRLINIILYHVVETKRAIFFIRFQLQLLYCVYTQPSTCEKRTSFTSKNHGRTWRRLILIFFVREREIETATKKKNVKEKRKSVWKNQKTRQRHSVHVHNIIIILGAHHTAAAAAVWVI